MQLTQYTDYALRLLIYMVNRPGRQVTTRAVADFYGISLNHLTKVAKGLTKAGWLEARRGVGGGLTMAAHTPEASVAEIVRRTENWALVECFDPKVNTCPIAGACHLKPMLYQAQTAFFDVLGRYKVKDLLQPATILAPAAKVAQPRQRVAKRGKPRA